MQQSNVPDTVVEPKALSDPIGIIGEIKMVNDMWIIPVEEIGLLTSQTTGVATAPTVPTAPAAAPETMELGSGSDDSAAMPLEKCGEVYQYLLTMVAQKPYTLINSDLSKLDSSGKSFFFCMLPGSFPGDTLGCIYECIEYKNMFFVFPHTIDIAAISATNEILRVHMDCISRLLINRLKTFYQERFVKMLDYKIVNYLPICAKISSCYVNGPYTKTIYEMRLNPDVQWYEYVMKVNQIIYNMNKHAKKSPTASYGLDKK